MLSPSLHNRSIRLAAFQNPEFFQAQGMRLSTFGKPRVINFAEDFPKHISLSRDGLEKVIELFETLKVKIEITDERNKGEQVDVQFNGLLPVAVQPPVLPSSASVATPCPLSYLN